MYQYLFNLHYLFSCVSAGLVQELRLLACQSEIYSIHLTLISLIIIKITIRQVHQRHELIDCNLCIYHNMSKLTRNLFIKDSGRVEPACSKATENSYFKLKLRSHRANGRVTDKKLFYPFVSVLCPFLIR